MTAKIKRAVRLRIREAEMLERIRFMEVQGMTNSMVVQEMIYYLEKKEMTF